MARMRIIVLPNLLGTSTHCDGKRLIDVCLPTIWPARSIEAVDGLDLAALFATYTGRGTKALWPDLLLKLVLYEIQRGRQSPAEWFLDAKENEPLQWMLFGMKPSRTALYEFSDRLEKFWDDWIQQTLHAAREQGMTLGDRAAVDGTLDCGIGFASSDGQSEDIDGSKGGA